MIARELQAAAAKRRFNLTIAALAALAFLVGYGIGAWIGLA